MKALREEREAAREARKAKIEERKIEFKQKMDALVERFKTDSKELKEKTSKSMREDRKVGQEKVTSDYLLNLKELREKAKESKKTNEQKEATQADVPVKA